MSMYEVGSELYAVSEALPRAAIADALGQLETVEARYARVLDGSGADVTDEIRGSLADVRRALEQADEQLHNVHESTVRYLAAVGFSGVTAEQVGSRTTSEALPASRRLHTVARTEINTKLREIARTDLGMETIARLPVPDGRVDWNVAALDYNPPFIDIPRGLSSARKPDDHPDVQDPAQIIEFTSVTGQPIARDSAGRPLNPMGRTGMAGRGMLNRWGENRAADLVLTRQNPHTGKLEVAAIQRSDTGEWALPGGKVDPNEAAREAAKREFHEEAGAEDFDLDMDQAAEIYAGYVDDSRNTDNAWMATNAFHRHLTADEANRLTLAHGSDAQGAAWIPVTARFFASHGQLVQRAVQRWRQSS